MRRLPSYNSSQNMNNNNINNNQNYKKNNNYPENNSQKSEFDFPTEEEIYNNNTPNPNNINNCDYDDDTDENITINIPRNHLNPFSRPSNNNINHSNNLNNINLNNNQYFNNNIFQNNSNIINNNINNFNFNNNFNPNHLNRINTSSKSFLDKNGNIIYNNNQNQIIHRNKGPELIQLDSHRIRVGQNEFEDLTKEAREIQNKEAFEKKILGIDKGKEIQDKQQKPFLEKVGDFFSDHQEGIYAFLDGIGCILLHGPSIGRTIDRIDNWINSSDDNLPGNLDNINNLDSNSQIRNFLSEKNKDYDTIMKFLPIWEIRENKKSDNNNNCVICLCEFNIGEQIAALPCLHIFHFECIKNWLKNELSCPVCKLQVNLNNIIGQNNN